MTHSNTKTKTGILRDSKLNDSRFKTLLSLLRLGGMPLYMKSISNVHAAYNVLLLFYAVSFYGYVYSQTSTGASHEEISRLNGNASRHVDTFQCQVQYAKLGRIL
jgi:hypothetical protein